MKILIALAVVAALLIGVGWIWSPSSSPTGTAPLNPIPAPSAAPGSLSPPTAAWWDSWPGLFARMEHISPSDLFIILLVLLVVAALLRWAFGWLGWRAPGGAYWTEPFVLLPVIAFLLVWVLPLLLDPMYTPYVGVLQKAGLAIVLLAFVLGLVLKLGPGLGRTVALTAVTVIAFLIFLPLVTKPGGWGPAYAVGTNATCQGPLPGTQKASSASPYVLAHPQCLNVVDPVSGCVAYHDVNGNEIASWCKGEKKSFWGTPHEVRPKGQSVVFFLHKECAQGTPSYNMDRCP
jgi:hypothetical protein